MCKGTPGSGPCAGTCYVPPGLQAFSEGPSASFSESHGRETPRGCSPRPCWTNGPRLSLYADPCGRPCRVVEVGDAATRTPTPKPRRSMEFVDVDDDPRAEHLPPAGAFRSILLHERPPGRASPSILHLEHLRRASGCSNGCFAPVPAAANADEYRLPRLPSLTRCPLLSPQPPRRPSVLPPSCSLRPVRNTPSPADPPRRLSCSAPPSPSMSPSPAAAPVCTCHFCVLIADDEPLNRKLASRIFTSMCPCAQVDVVPHGQAAVEAFERAPKDHPYDAAVLDLEMPVLTGMEAARAMRRAEGAAHATRLVAWSSSLDREGAGDVRGRCLDAGFDETVNKPCPPATLLTRTVASLHHEPGCPYCDPPFALPPAAAVASA